MHDSQRNADEPETIQLESGALRMSALAVGKGDAVLFVHGFPDHARSFRNQLPVFAEAGWRVVAPMLRGYEPSSQPGRDIADFHPMRIAEDIVTWARQLGAGEPVHLIGHDWGGVAGFLACHLKPSLFRSFASIAIPSIQALNHGVWRYPGQIRNSWYILFFQLRGLADKTVRAWDFAFIEKLWRDWSPGWQWDPNEMASLKQTFCQPGVLWSALAYYRATLHPLLPEQKRMRTILRTPNPVPTLTVTGANDGCIDTRLFDCQSEKHFTNGLRTHRIFGAGHFVHQERPDEVNELLLRWVRTH